MPTYTSPAPDYTDPKMPDAVNRIQDLVITRVKKVREANAYSTAAWELTFKFNGLAADKAKGQGAVAAGMQIALLPVNDDARVKRVLAALPDAPADNTTVALPKRDGVALPDRALSATQILAHTVDLTRPTPQLYDLVAFGRQPGKEWDQPLSQFMETLAKQPTSETLKTLYTQLAKSAPQDKSGVTLRSFLQGLGNSGKLSFDATKDAFTALGFQTATVNDASLPVEQFLELPEVRGKVTFNQLLRNQPPLENRKYTPSHVDVKNSEISLLVSEVHKPITTPDGKKIDSVGTTTDYLSTLANTYDPKNPPTVKGFLDLRKHKLPYLKSEGPKILISTGVGIAPHVAYLRECAEEKRDNKVVLMLSGERTPADHLLDGEIKGYLPAQGVFNHVYSKLEGNSKKYVGDALLQHGDAVWKALQEDKGCIYLCGKEDMRDGIDASLRQIAQAHGVNGETWVKDLYEGKQIQESMSFDDRFFNEKWPKHVKARAKEEAAASPAK